MKHNQVQALGTSTQLGDLPTAAVIREVRNQWRSDQAGVLNDSEREDPRLMLDMGQEQKINFLVLKPLRFGRLVVTA